MPVQARQYPLNIDNALERCVAVRIFEVHLRPLDKTVNAYVRQSSETVNAHIRQSSECVAYKTVNTTRVVLPAVMSPHFSASSIIANLRNTLLINLHRAIVIE